MTKYRSQLFIAAIFASGLMVGCKSKSTAPFAPVCSSEFVDAYTDLDKESQRFTLLLNQYNDGDRSVSRNLKRTARRVVESCTAIYQQTQATSCISSADSSASATISATDFSDVCDQADALLSGKPGDKGNWKRPGQPPVNKWDQEKAIKDLQGSDLSMRIIGSELVKDALDPNRPVSFVNGRLVSLADVAEAVQRQGQTACALKTTERRIVAAKTSFKRLNSRVVTSRSGKSLEVVLLVSDHNLQISCQKEASQPITVDDISDALRGAIEIESNL